MFKLGKLDLPDSVTFIGENALPPKRPVAKKAPDPDPQDHLVTIVTDSDPDGELAQKVTSVPARHPDDAPDGPSGKLVLMPGSFSYTSPTDRPGWPSEKGRFDMWGEPYSLQEDTLAITTTDRTYRFCLSGAAYDDVAFYLELLRMLRERTAPYSDPIATACANGSWPGVRHPFFQKNATDSTDVEALFELLAQDRSLRLYAFASLPWFSRDTEIAQSKHSLVVTSKNGSEGYGYRETEGEVSLSYHTYQVGFFDDSEYEREASVTLRRVENPAGSVVGAALAVSDLDRSALSLHTLYLKNPFGMSGIFQLSW